jgi:hypothetical protein
MTSRTFDRIILGYCQISGLWGVYKRTCYKIAMLMTILFYTTAFKYAIEPSLIFLGDKVKPRCDEIRVVLFVFF